MGTSAKVWGGASSFDSDLFRNILGSATDSDHAKCSLIIIKRKHKHENGNEINNTKTIMSQRNKAVYHLNIPL